LAVLPPVGRSRRVRRSGYDASESWWGSKEDDPDTKARAGFRQGLETLGWWESQNVRVDYRFAPAGVEARVLAKELVALQPDVILSVASPATSALQRETQTVPIVFVNVSDPSFVTNLARPDGNLTGQLLFEPSVTGKWLAMLKGIAPALSRAGFVINPKTAAYYEYYLRAAQAAASSLAIELVFTPIEDAAADIERAIGSFAQAPNGGLLLPPDTNTNINRDLIIGLAARHHLPAVYSDRLFVVAGGLICYSTDRVEQFRWAASYVDRILRGAKLADLPVQVPTKFETVINLKTAKALNLSVPPVLLVAADEVIE
jgi:putative tryptophan/tyrosine transport system substrate-binding protein